MIILETPRLLLRRFTEADAPLVYQLNSDPEVLQYLHEPLLTSVEHAQKIIKEIILPQYRHQLGRWAIHTKEDGSFIGWCGLKYRPELDEIDLGYRFSKASWGRGFATESAKHVLEFGFHELRLPAITGRAHIHNTASIKVLDKIGMQYIKDEVVDDCPVKTYLLNNPY